MAELKPHHRQALEFLQRTGPHCIGVIDDDEKFAAAFVFVELTDMGLVISTIGDDGPVQHLTNKGRALIARTGP